MTAFSKRSVGYTGYCVLSQKSVERSFFAFIMFLGVAFVTFLWLFPCFSKLHGGGIDPEALLVFQKGRGRAEMWVRERMEAGADSEKSRQLIISVLSRHHGTAQGKKIKMGGS